MKTTRALICKTPLFLLLCSNSYAFTPNLPPSYHGDPSLTTGTAMPATQTASIAPLDVNPIPLPTTTTTQDYEILEPQMNPQMKTDSQEDIMTIVPPSDEEMVDLLLRLDSVLRRPGVQFHFEQLLLLENNSVRRINAGRYEVFIADADGKGSTAFDWLCSKMVPEFPQMIDKETIKQRILEYARQQAVAAGFPNYRFHNFALIINYNECPQQFPHIDLQDPNAQFALIVTDQSPGTVWFEPQHTIQSPRDLAQAWQSTSSAANWIQAMENSPKCKHLLERFGDVLSPTLTRYEPNNGNPLPSGTLLSLPGGVVHAGPESSKFRAVLFFTGHPLVEASIRPYNPDVQYFDSILLSDMIAAIWNDLNVSERVELLGQLANYLEKAEYKKMHLHLPAWTSMHQFAKGIETQEIGSNEEELQQYIHDFANQEQLLI